MKLARRGTLVLFAALAVSFATGCKKKEELRCAYCGMAIKPDNPWRVEMTTGAGATKHFDTPRCAFETKLEGKGDVKSLRFQDFYDRTWHEASELSYAVSSDVMGPMGHDLVPLLPAHAEKFKKDHHAKEILGYDQVTSKVLDDLGK
jgi:hypothetical protein